MTDQHNELKAILSEALSRFKLTQDPNIYPEDHWSRRAEKLLAEPRPAQDQPTSKVQVSERKSFPVALPKGVSQAHWNAFCEMQDVKKRTDLVPAHKVCRMLEILAEHFPDQSAEITSLKRQLREADEKLRPEEPTIRQDRKVQVSESYQLKILDHDPLTYFYKEFPATVGHIPLIEFTKAVREQSEDLKDLKKYKEVFDGLFNRMSDQRNDNSILRERVKALEVGLNKAVVTLDHIGTEKIGWSIRSQAIDTAVELKPLLQPAKEVR